MASGGKRAGAGRPADAEGNRVSIAARVRPSTRAKLLEGAEKEGRSLGSYLDKIAETLE